MKKREFLALGGAVPLMLAGCGGDDSGSAPVRLVNASVGYTDGLGFMVNTTQATTADVAYGSASPFESVEAGTVTTAITKTTAGSVATIQSTTRTLSKDSRYNLVAYGFSGELRSLLITERDTAPDSGYSAVNVLNTSSDIGPVDVYVSQQPGLTLATQIAASVGSTSGPAQSVFSQVLPGSYYITVTGANSRTDIRFQSPATIALVDQQIVTIILTPGASGTLANAIVLTQGTASAAPTSFVNATSRVRVVSSVNDDNALIGVTGILDPAIAAPSPTLYSVVPAGAAPTVTVNGTALANAGTLSAGGDYTLMIYLGADGTPTNSLLLDDNTVPITTTNAKMRLLNLVYNPNTANHSLGLAMYVNSTLIATNVGYASASDYVEVPVPTNQQSLIEIKAGSVVVASHSTPIAVSKTYTDIVVGSGSIGDYANIQDSFFSSTPTTS